MRKNLYRLTDLDLIKVIDKTDMRSSKKAKIAYNLALLNTVAIIILIIVFFLN